MLERSSKLLVFALIACSILPGCSSFSKNERDRKAYARYVQKYSRNRVKQQTRFKRAKVPFFHPAQNVVNASSDQAPQSVTSSSPSQ